MNDQGDSDILHKFDIALQLGGMRAKLRHKREGTSIAIMEGDTIKIVPPEEIVVDMEQMERLEVEVRAIQEREGLTGRKRILFKGY